MQKLKMNTPAAESLLSRVQIGALAVAGVLEVLLMVLAHHVTYAIVHWGLLAATLAFVVTVILQLRRINHKFPLALGCAMMLWLLIIYQIQTESPMHFSQFCFSASVYFFAYPFAAAARDENRQLGLKITAACYILAALGLVAYGITLMLDMVPWVLRNIIYWGESRINVMQHPNVAGRTFMIGIAFCLGGMANVRKKWLKWTLLVAAALMFMTQSLTNSRAPLLLTILLIAGTVFFRIFKGTWKQFFCGAVAAVAAVVVLFCGSQWLYQWNTQRLLDLQNVTAQEASVCSEEILLSEQVPDADTLTYAVVTLADMAVPLSNELPPEASNQQGTLIHDMPTLNNRTWIWSLELQRIKENPAILLWGIPSTRYESPEITFVHAHNAWLELLLRTGLAGFVMCLIFTGQAIWSAALLLLNVRTELWKKVIALLTLCQLVSAMLEPTLFLTAERWHHIDFVFFLCLGYLIQWRRQLKTAAV